jgi:predicted transposase/invertase (TIGR01784 family)
MPLKKDQPHDAVFKAFFSDARIAQNYLLHYTSEAIHSRVDFSFFERSNTEFVSSRFGISFSDVLYSARLTDGSMARLMFLYEHKSYVPGLPIHLQLLDYLLQIWEDDIKNERPFSIIIPIVVYHGKQRWVQKPFSDYFPNMPAAWRHFIPDFQYHLTDLNAVSPQFIQDKPESEFLRNLFLTLKFARSEQLLKENWKNVFNFESSIKIGDRERILVQTLTLYIVNLFDMPTAEIIELNEQLPEKDEYSWMDALPEVLTERFKKEGWKKGKKEGKIEGKIEENLELSTAFTIRAIQKFPNMTDAEIAELVGVTIEFVQTVRKNLSASK